MSKANGTSRAKAKSPVASAPRRVDYYNYAQDLQCVILASVGLYDWAISEITGLTVGQVRYRLQKSEEDRRRGDPTNRTLYRQGQSPVVQAIVSSVTRANNPVKRIVTNRLDQKGLYRAKAK